MKKNWMELRGEKVRKQKEETEKFKEKYWKLPATERMHYDSICGRIYEASWKPGWLSFYWLKITILLPLFFIFIGFFTGTLEILFPSAKNMTIQLITMFPAVFAIDLIVSILFPLYINKDKFRKLNKRFKLIK